MSLDWNEAGFSSFTHRCEERFHREQHLKLQATARATKKETAMSGSKALGVLAIATVLSVLGTSSAAWSYFDGRYFRGGFVKPCSLDGVNPAYHPDIFGNPAFARAVYGFVRGRDGAWHVVANCYLYN